MIVTRGLGRGLAAGIIVAVGLGLTSITEVVPVQQPVRLEAGAGGSAGLDGGRGRVIERGFAKFLESIRAAGKTPAARVAASVTISTASVQGGGAAGHAKVRTEVSKSASVVAAAGHTGPGTVKVGTSVAAMSLSGGGMAPVAKVEYLSVDELLMIVEEMG